MTNKQFQTLLVVGGIAAIYLLNKGSKVAQAAGASAVAAVSPTSSNNLIYRGVNAVGDIVGDGTDNDSFNLGYWLYDITHRGD